MMAARKAAQRKYNTCCSLSRIFTFRCIRHDEVFRCIGFIAQHVLLILLSKQLGARTLLTTHRNSPRLARNYYNSKVCNVCCSSKAGTSSLCSTCSKVGNRRHLCALRKLSRNARIASSRPVIPGNCILLLTNVHVRGGTRVIGANDFDDHRNGSRQARTARRRR